MPYTALTKTITINILNFRYLQAMERFHTTFHLYEDEEQVPLMDVLEIHFMQLSKQMDKWEQRAVNPHDKELVRMAKGMAEGERLKAIEVTKNLLAMDMAVDGIVKATGLLAEEVEKLEKSAPLISLILSLK